MNISKKDKQICSICGGEIQKSCISKSDLFIVHWSIDQLNILLDMMEDRDYDPWFIRKISEIVEKMKLLDH